MKTPTETTAAITAAAAKLTEEAGLIRAARLFDRADAYVKQAYTARAVYARPGVAFKASRRAAAMEEAAWIFAYAALETGRAARAATHAAA